MQSGRLFIDGNDAFTTYGAYMTEGALAEVVQWPALKDVDSVDWHEEDGEEYDLDNPVLDTREIELPLCVRSYDGLAALQDALSDGAYHTFLFELLSYTITLRLVEADISSRTSDGLYLLTLKLADDVPLNGYEYVAPTNDLGLSVTDDAQYWLDGVAMTDYGVRMLQGTLAEVTAVPDVKENMLRDIAVSAGVEYDGEAVTYESRDVKLYCLMRTSSAAAFLQNWNALLYDLTRSGEHTLTVGAVEKLLSCFYRECEVTEMFCDSEGVWCRFTIKLCAIAQEDAVLTYNVYQTTSVGETVKLTAKAEYFTSIIVDGEELQDGTVTGSLDYTFEDEGEHKVLLVTDDTTTTLAKAFYQCASLVRSVISVPFSVEYLSNMYRGCDALVSVDCSRWDISNVNDTSYMFYRCYALSDLDSGGWDTANITYMKCMFYDCRSLVELDASGWDTNGVTSMSYMLYSCTNLVRVNGILNQDCNESLSSMCRNAETIDELTLYDLGANEDIDMSRAFEGMSNWGRTTKGRASLVNTLITYSYNRATIGFDTLTIGLPPKVLARLSDDEVAAIVARGFVLEEI